MLRLLDVPKMRVYAEAERLSSIAAENPLIALENVVAYFGHTFTVSFEAS